MEEGEHDGPTGEHAAAAVNCHPRVPRPLGRCGPELGRAGCGRGHAVQPGEGPPEPQDQERSHRASVRRPVVSTALVGPSGEASSGVYALVDSGCSHILAAPWLAVAAGVEPKDSVRELSLGIGGTTVKARFLDLRVRLLAPGGTDEQYFEWGNWSGSLIVWHSVTVQVPDRRAWLIWSCDW